MRNFIHEEYNYGVRKSEFSSGGKYIVGSVFYSYTEYIEIPPVMSLKLQNPLTQEFLIRVKKYLNISLFTRY